MPPIRLLLVDDHALFREGLAGPFAYQPDFAVVGTRRFDHTAYGPWIESAWPSPKGYRWPTYTFARTAAEVTLIGREDVEGSLAR